MRNLHIVFKKAISAIIALFFVAVAACAPLLFSACGEKGENKVEDVYNVGGTEQDGVAEETPSESETAKVTGLTIPLSDFSTTAKFYGVYVDGTYMEVIAVKYNGEYRTAFNTCQVCYGSPYAYFKQSGNTLVCQNCHNTFSMAMVGVTLGSCNPYPILASDRVQTDDAIIIPDSFLIKCKGIFANWTGGF